MIKKQLKTSREQRNTENRNSLHEAIRRSMRQSFKAADYQAPPGRKTVHVSRPSNSTTFIRNGTMKVRTTFLFFPSLAPEKIG